MPSVYPSKKRERHFRLASISRFVKRFHEACKAVKPSVPIWHNWFTHKHRADLRDARYVDISYEEFADPFSTLYIQGIFGAEAMISGKLLQNPQRRVCLVLGGRAYDYFPVRKQTALIDQGYIDLCIAGKGPYGRDGARWVPPNMDWFYYDLVPFYAMVAETEPYLAGATPIPDWGVVYSEASRFRFNGWKRDPVIQPLVELVEHCLARNRLPVFLSSFHLPDLKGNPPQGERSSEAPVGGTTVMQTKAG